MFLNINQLDFACLSAGVPLDCLPSPEKGDIPRFQNSDCPPFQANDFSMAIVINLGALLARRKMSVTELADNVGVTLANISVLKTGKVRAIRLSTLESICNALDCQPGDILEFKPT